MLYQFIKTRTKQKNPTKLDCQHCLFIKSLFVNPISYSPVSFLPFSFFFLSLFLSFCSLSPSSPSFFPPTEIQSHGAQRCKVMLFTMMRAIKGGTEICTKGYENREEHFQVFHSESGRLRQEMFLKNIPGLSDRMRSRRTAQMLANHEEFPAASLTLVFSHGLCEWGVGVAPRDSCS